ncbi:MAG: SIS domain-containing protein, partial [bacterium]|nr:SIS domain-containing protein [bacterium]
MCGIIAYAGHRDARRIINHGLKKLEYRGYDSWGIGVIDNGQCKVYKKTGKVSVASWRSLPLPKSTMGFGHTRWATHGGVKIANAHPHFSQSRLVCVAHNGVIENFRSLKKKLEKKGYRFKSETDTEVFANLIEDYLKKGLSAFSAIARAFVSCAGRNAFVVYHLKTKQFFALKKGSPLVFGQNGQGEYFIASDLAAFLEHQPKIQYLEDNKILILSSAGFALHSRQAKRELALHFTLPQLKAQEAEKKNYPYFMIKEIMEQPEVLERVRNQEKDLFAAAVRKIQAARQIYFIGAGTAGEVCRCGSYIFAKVAAKSSLAIVASEFTHFQNLLNPEILIIAVSQSGETADTLEAVEKAKRAGCAVIALTNILHSSLCRMAD